MEAALIAPLLPPLLPYICGFLAIILIYLVASCDPCCGLSRIPKRVVNGGLKLGQKGMRKSKQLYQEAKDKLFGSKLQQLEKEIQKLKEKNENLEVTLRESKADCALLSAKISRQDEKAELLFENIVDVRSTFQSIAINQIKQHNNTFIKRLNAQLITHQMATMSNIHERNRKQVHDYFKTAETAGLISNLHVSQDDFPFMASQASIAKVVAALRRAVDSKTVDLIISWVRELPPPSDEKQNHALVIIYKKASDTGTYALLFLSCKWHKTLVNKATWADPSEIKTLIATFDLHPPARLAEH